MNNRRADMTDERGQRITVMDAEQRRAAASWRDRKERFGMR